MKNTERKMAGCMGTAIVHRPFLFGLLSAGLCCGLFGCGENSPAQGDKSAGLPLSVSIVTVASGNRVFGSELPGTVTSKDHATLEAKLNARVDEVRVVEGQHVEKDELLVVLDAAEVKAKLNQAQATQEQSARDFHRYQMLIDRKAVSQQEFETVRSRAEVAAAAFAEAQSVLGYTRITAPFAGVVSRKFVSPGDLASLGKPLLELDNSASLRLVVAVPERSASQIALGQTYSVQIPSAHIDIPAVVAEISPSADLATRTYEVKFDLKENPLLRLGQYGTLLLPDMDRTTIAIPRRALLERGQLEIVFVVRDGRVFLRLVRSGRSNAEEVEILSGLEVGETIALDPQRNWRDGQAVEVHS